MSAAAESGVSETAALQVKVNDESRTLLAGATVASVVADLGLADRKGVAIAVNGNVAPRSTWAAHALASGDRVLVIRATQGG